MGRARAALALTGAGCVLAGVLVPYNRGGESFVHTSILDPQYLSTSAGFAIEPLAVALTALIAVVLAGRGRTPGLVLLVIGAQSFLLFLGYMIVTAAADGTYSSFGPGALVGAVGSLLIAAAGLAAVRGRPSYR